MKSRLRAYRNHRRFVPALLLLAASSGCSDEAQRTLLVAFETAVRTIADGLISAALVALAGDRSVF